MCVCDVIVIIIVGGHAADGRKILFTHTKKKGEKKIKRKRKRRKISLANISQFTMFAESLMCSEILYS